MSFTLLRNKLLLRTFQLPTLSEQQHSALGDAVTMGHIMAILTLKSFKISQLLLIITDDDKPLLFMFISKIVLDKQLLSCWEHLRELERQLKTHFRSWELPSRKSQEQGH